MSSCCTKCCTCECGAQITEQRVQNTIKLTRIFLRLANKICNRDPRMVDVVRVTVRYALTGENVLPDSPIDPVNGDAYKTDPFLRDYAVISGELLASMFADRPVEAAVMERINHIRRLGQAN